MHSDALRLGFTPVLGIDPIIDVPSLLFAGTIPGVMILAAGGANGPGTGLLTSAAGGLSWQAPGSSTAGPPVPCLWDGDYLLEDGTAAPPGTGSAAYLRVRVYVDYLSPSAQAQVYLRENYNTLGPADVSASDALAGVVASTIFVLQNYSPNTVTAVKLWLDSTDSGLEVSTDGTTYYAPTSSTDPHVLTWASIAPGDVAQVWVRRTIAAASLSAAAVLNLLHFQWFGA